MNFNFSSFLPNASPLYHFISRQYRTNVNQFQPKKVPLREATAEEVFCERHWTGFRNRHFASLMQTNSLIQKQFW